MPSPPLNSTLFPRSLANGLSLGPTRRRKFCLNSLDRCGGSVDRSEVERSNVDRETVLSNERGRRDGLSFHERRGQKRIETHLSFAREGFEVLQQTVCSAVREVSELFNRGRVLFERDEDGDLSRRVVRVDQD